MNATNFTIFALSLIKQMIMRHIIQFLVITSFLLFISSCTKHEGEGGTSSIYGKINVHLCSDNFDITYAEFPGEEIDVYIIYGDNEFYSDKTSTQYDGSYKFKYLRKGDYRIFVYSDDTLGQSASGHTAIIKSVEINKNGKEIQLETIDIYDQVSNYEGSSTIKGKVFAYDWNSEMTILKDSFYIRNEYVYIARKADDYYFERQRTFYDGGFVFNSLPIGDYEVYVYSRDANQQDPQDEVPIIKIAEITANRQTVNIGRIEIIK